MNIKILGTGCPKCKTLEKVTRQAVDELGIKATIEKVEDIVKIMAYNVMHTPVLVINEKIVLKGIVPGVNQVKEILIQNK
jgi:small redox-active disulfide protein 2